MSRDLTTKAKCKIKWIGYQDVYDVLVKVVRDTEKQSIVYWELLK